jgi:acyl transferase domain-containing protein/aryl carrier-like protein
LRTDVILTKQWQRVESGGSRFKPNAAISLPEGALIIASDDTQDLAYGIASCFPRSRVVTLTANTQQEDIDPAEWPAWIDVTGCGRRIAHELQWVETLQRWVEHWRAIGATVLQLTRGLEAFENDAINLAGADRVGLYRMLSSEYERLRSRHVDVAPHASDAEVVRQLLDELGRNGSETEVCYRAGERYAAALRPLEPDAATAQDVRGRKAIVSLADGRALWVTGGTRGIGYLSALHLARRYGIKRFVLTGREELPPRSEWEQHGKRTESIGRKITAIRALESLGVEVRTLAVALEDRAALQISIDELRREFGPIGGLIHGAGSVDMENPAFIRKTLAGWREVVAPKIQGLDNLLACLAGDPLQFVLLYSSAAAIVPDLAAGLSDYAMANAYMDYVATANASRVPTLSLQWSSWRDTGIGAAVSTSFQRLGLISHTDEEGLRLLDRVLTSWSMAVALPAIVDDSRWRPQDLLVGRADRRPESTQEPQAIASWVAAVICSQLGIDPREVDPHRPLPDYGADSVLLAQALQQIGRRAGVTLDPSILFEHPTLHSFSTWLSDKHSRAFAVDDAAAGDDEGAAGTTSVSVSQLRRPGSAENLSQTDIAIVGLSCRFPGADDPDQYWELLANGRSAVDVASRRPSVFPSGLSAALLDDVRRFDPGFFGIAAADAQAMDPQALLLLEESLRLWCRAGYTLEELRGSSVGVYVGARSRRVLDRMALRATENPTVVIGQNYLAANISRCFDLRGPSLVVDSACSSGLVALSVAMQALRSGEITSALVAASSLLDCDEAVRLFQQRGILSRDSRLHLFDQRAQGLILGEGAGLVWLKTVARALADRDPLYAIVRSVAVNNDGRTAGPGSPSFEACKAVMQSALARSGRTAAEVDHVEVNGSGSTITDLLELKAIEAVYRHSLSQPCELGSPKPNIGHVLNAAAIASLIKAALMLQRRASVPFLSAEEPMEHYDLALSPFRFARTLRKSDSPRVIAINSFADGGTNAHAILEATDDSRAAQTLRRPIDLPPSSLLREAAARRPDRPEFWEDVDCGQVAAAARAG